MRKKYKSKLKEQRGNYEQLLTTKLESLDRNGNDEFWKCLKQMRGNKHDEEEELLSTETLLAHYEQLYQATTDKNVLNNSDTINKMIMFSPSALNILISLFNLIFNSRHFPSQWNFGLIKNIHKAGNNDDPSNY